MSYPMVGRLYRHYKGGEYRVLHIGLNESDKTSVVVYQGVVVNGPEWYRQVVWVRPLASWCEEVVRSDGMGRCPRFVAID